MASNEALTPARELGWLQGFNNLVKNENRKWWKTRTWLVQSLIWTAIINGMLILIIVVVPRTVAAQSGSTADAVELLSMGLSILFTFAGLAPAVGIVTIGQDAVIQEKQSGTAAWILSKPASRAAFILSKLVADALGALVTMVLIPGLVAYVIITNVTGRSIPVTGFAAALGLVYLALLFYLTLAILLGTLFNSRGAVIGIPMLLIFGYQIFVGLVPWTGKIMPWNLTIDLSPNLPSMAAALARGQMVTDSTPLIATLVWIVLFTVVALWRFDREEF